MTTSTVCFQKMRDTGSWIHRCRTSLAGSACGLGAERAFQSITATRAARHDAMDDAKRTQQSTPRGRGKGGAVFDPAWPRAARGELPDGWLKLSARTLFVVTVCDTRNSAPMSSARIPGDQAGDNGPGESSRHARRYNSSG